VATNTDYTYSTGMAGLGCGWHAAQFDDFTLRRLHRGSDFNFALTATASASSVWQDDSAYVAAMANDGDPTTRWNTAYPTLPNEWLELDFLTSITFNQTTYSQYDSRIFGYQIQHWNGANWSVDVNGGTMGNFAMDTFPAVTSSKVRLLLTNVTSSPSIYEFGVYDVLSPAATNLAPSATASASSIWSSSYSAAKANDNSFSTRWNSASGATSGEWLELDWPAPVSFNRTVLWQFMDRITSYKIQHWNGGGWTDDAVGGQFGSSASDVFPTVTSAKARFLVVTATNVPSIYEFQVFDDPSAAASTVVPVRVNEWMINNTRTIADPAGGFQPWFELYNAGASNVNLAGDCLTGSLTNLFQFRIPSGYSLPAGGFLMVWTDGRTNQNLGGGSDLHVNFSLQQSTIIGLFDTNGQVVDAVDLTAQPADAASGSIPDGDAAILNLFGATPCQSNDRIWDLSPVRRVNDGAMLLNFAGIPFASHRILAADTLQNPVWTNLATVFADGLGLLGFADTSAQTRSRRFYRAVSP
jgi:hypothetical protein